MSCSSFRRQLLCGVSAFALPIAVTLTPVHADGFPPGTSISIEGGAICGLGDNGTISATQDFYTTPYGSGSVTAKSSFGKVDCGSTGRLGLFQEQQGMFGFADYWGIFVRHEDFGSQKFSASNSKSIPVPFNALPNTYTYHFGVDSAGAFDEERTVVDFEVGKDLGIGAPDTKVRFFGGLRYARYTSELTDHGKASASLGSDICVNAPCTSFSYGYNFAFQARDTFQGFGPRLGLSGQFPLYRDISMVFSGSGSALWGNHDVQISDTISGATGKFTFSDTGWVTNLEGEVGLSWLLSPRGAKLVAGVRWEGWFDQNQFKDYTVALDTTASAISKDCGSGSLDRNDWGPFVRFNLPIGGAPPVTPLK